MRTHQRIGISLILLFLGVSPAFPQDPGPGELIDRMAREKAFQVRERIVSAKEERLVKVEHALADLQRQMRELQQELRNLGPPAQGSREMK